jgi:hypothetical protein
MAPRFDDLLVGVFGVPISFGFHSQVSSKAVIWKVDWVPSFSAKRTLHPNDEDQSLGTPVVGAGVEGWV